MVFESIQKEMEFNGYSHFNKENYLAKNKKPCFIPENGDSVEDVESWTSLFNTAFETITTKDFLLSVAENYDQSEEILKEIEESTTIDFEHYYSLICSQTSKEFAETFMDNYFLGGGEVWCSISTKLDDYTN